ncbi:acyl-CoA dehydrogenase family protein [Nocardia brevicatena]|uniref:acyl-CoA dehydrogenase family protein n=1 Tax=Nocardia brevicatena TaxID=37327 RepID=UPI000594FA19|nr:hypothetical protein [Nocardia brevicatena]
MSRSTVRTWPPTARPARSSCGSGTFPKTILTYAQEAGIASDLLRAVLAEVGVPAHELAADAHLRGAFGDWAAVAAPHLFTVWTGHFDLTIGAIGVHGTGAPYQRQCLDELDSGAAVGVFALTELGGTNGANQQTTATWDAEKDGFWLTHPTVGSVKFMPNTADPTVPKIVVFTARLVVAGRDEGVMLFLMRLRTAEGLAAGIAVGEVSGKLGAAMDHGWILGHKAFIPRHGLLAGDWATITDDGEFVCEVPVRQRFHRSITPLIGGRLDLATGTVAGARAGVAGLVNYASQRPHGDGDALRRDLVTAAAHTYACSVLGRMVRDLSTEPDHRQRLPLWLMVVKPLLTTLAQDALRTCRDRAGAQGHLRCNYYPDWNANTTGAKTAEGETQVLEKAAGRAHKALATLILPGTPDTRPWWLNMITTREDTLAIDLDTATGIEASDQEYEPEGTALGIDSTRVDLARTAGVRLAVTAALIAAEATSDPDAATVAAAAAAVVALTYLDRHGTWYTAHGAHSAGRAREIHTELRRHRGILAENLTTLAAAFDIPQLPGAPMFTPDYLKAWSHRAGWDAHSFLPQR